MIKKDAAYKRRQRKITSILTLSVFLVLMGTMIVVGGAGYILMGLDIMDIEIPSISNWAIWLIFILASVFMGTTVTALISRFITKPVNTVAQGMSLLASGDFSARIELNKNEESQKLANGFNKLAEELQSIQMLRSDFINEFAHEFKTPIVSIKGFAELLIKDNLTEEQRKEYAAVILEEAERLSILSSNALNLSKVENQNILTDVTRFNVSEQIRSCLLLLEKKWTEKNLELNIDFDEFSVRANEEMLKQVWINLLENAVKFSIEEGVLEISIAMEESKLKVCVKNEGVELEEEDKHKVFEKFYRADSSHMVEGNGVGLAIVKRIVDLHGGKVEADSGGGKTWFTVYLPYARKIV